MSATALDEMELPAWADLQDSSLPSLQLLTWLCPCLTSTHSYSWPGSASQIHTVLSLLQVANSMPPGLQATPLTSFSCPSKTATCSQSSPCKVNGLRVWSCFIFTCASKYMYWNVCCNAISVELLSWKLFAILLSIPAVLLVACLPMLPDYELVCKYSLTLEANLNVVTQTLLRFFKLSSWKTIRERLSLVMP